MRRFTYTQDALSNANLHSAEEAVTEKTHRVKAGKNKENNTPRTTLCRILNYKNKVKTSRNFKKN